MPQIPEICRPTALVLGAILLCLAPAAALAQADVNASDLHGR
ncbi:MAG TPA: hypothetical protein VK862_05945 [Afifellaceae bacterium]|nr:hypothetical protein [Afifellaceae bacterium]